MTRILAFIRRLYRDIQHNNRLARATHRQENKQQLPPIPKRGRKR